VRLQPAPSNTGIVFRVAGHENASFGLGSATPTAAPHATLLATPCWRLSTVEHLVAALWAMRIDNIIITVDGPEMPIMDGSSLPFILLLQQAGVQTQEAPRRYLSVAQTKRWEDAKRNGFIEIAPPRVDQEELELVYEAESGTHEMVLTPELFMREIAPARTCGLLGQLPQLRAMGLARGSTAGNTIVIGDNRQYLNTPRFADEPMRHKVLDLVGDLMLLGYPLAGSIHARNTGHSFNREVVVDYLSNPLSWFLQPAEQPKDVAIREEQKECQHQS
jgi:UDP-3-O-[3-hydroxymyristoyl] N-acetylglucosamine deacetylase